MLKYLYGLLAINLKITDIMWKFKFVTFDKYLPYFWQNKLFLKKKAN